jgi:hypothetical protein
VTRTDLLLRGIARRAAEGATGLTEPQDHRARFGRCVTKPTHVLPYW